MLLYRNPAIGLDAAHDYRIMYEARAEPALSTRGSLVISYNVNSEAVTTGCVPMSAYTNTVTQPRFITVPLAAFDPGPDMGTGAVRAASAAPDYPAGRAAAPVPVVQLLELPGRLPAGAGTVRRARQSGRR